MTRGKVHLRTFSHSEMQTFADCRNRWGYAYAERLRPDRQASYFRWGSAWHRVVGRTVEDVHDLLGRYARLAPGAALETACAAAADYVRAEIDAARDAASGYDGIGHEDLADISDAKEWLSFQARHYFERTPCDWLDYALIGVELPFVVPLRDALGRPIAHASYEGVIDLLMLHQPTGRVAVMDHKALASLANADRRLELDDQTTGYLYAARELWRAKRLPHQQLPHAAELDAISEDSFSLVVHNLVRKAAPAEPRVNKLKKGDSVDHERLKQLEADTGRSQGAVSTAACDTLFEIYQRALVVQASERNIPIDSDQQARLEQLRARGDMFFRRVESVRTARDLDRWCSEHVTAQRFIREAELDERLRVRNPGACTGQSDAPCAYQPLCEMGDSASTRPAGARVIGYVRAEDLHQEVRDAEKEREERERTREQRIRELDERRSRDEAQARERRQGDGAAPGEGGSGGQGGGGGAEAHHGFF